MPYKKKSDYAPHINPASAPPCDMPGCAEPGAYKAPKSKDDLQEYCWLCLEHVRQRNQQWDYFAGLERDEIEAFIKDAVTGHRPTWNREDRTGQKYRQLQDALYEFMHTGKQPARPAAPSLPAKLRKALATMELEHPYTAQTLKRRYRAMVKQHHPDVNKGDKNSEEKFKHIATAYHYLLEQLKTQ
jgi:DnaJ-domain-containing protein 1